MRASPTLWLLSIGLLWACEPLDERPAGEAEIVAVRSVARGLGSTLDAAPDPTGTRVYFTALRREQDAALFAAPITGGPAELLAQGFDAPLGVVSSLDGERVFVADAGDQGAGDDPKRRAPRGLITAVGLDGRKTPLELTRGRAPRGVTVVKLEELEWLYFTGVDPERHLPAVYRLTGLSRLELVHAGAPLVDPSGLAVSAAGDVYVTDLGGPVEGGAILQLSHGAASYLVRGLTLSAPAGIALSQGERHLLVSALEERGLATLARVEISSARVTLFDEGVSKHRDAAGLHRAHRADRYAWSSGAGAQSAVFAVGTRRDPLP